MVAQLDVLVSFATVAALSPSSYVRPTLSPLTSRTRSPKEVSEVSGDSMEEAPQDSGGGANGAWAMDRKIVLKKARHPCVELMDGVDFIGNEYDLDEQSSNFQIITGPNMVRYLISLNH
jgi:DNA mismatch repair protein MSH2